METPPKRTAANASPAKPLDRMLRNGSQEPLAKAKEALKARLRENMMQEVVDGFTDVEQEADVVAARVDLDAAPFPKIKASASGELRACLADEVAASLRDAEDELVARVKEDAAHVLDALKRRVVERLLNDVMAQAIEELHREVGGPGGDGAFAAYEPAGVPGPDDPASREADTYDAVFHATGDGSVEARQHEASLVAPHPDDAEAGLAWSGAILASERSEARAPVPVVDTDEGEAADAVWHVYAVARAAAPLDEVVPALAEADGEADLSTVAHDGLQAVVGVLGRESLNAEDRGAAHAAVVRKVAEQGVVVPHAADSMFSSEAAVVDYLASKAVSLGETLDRLSGKQEWSLKIYRDVERLRGNVLEKSEKVRDLMADIKSRPKGVARFIKKQMVSTIHEEVELVSDTCVKQCHEHLMAIAEDGEVGDFQGAAVGQDGELILDASYFVADDMEDAFSDQVEALRGEFGELGFRFHLTGPLPPLSFVPVSRGR